MQRMSVPTKVEAVHQIGSRQCNEIDIGYVIVLAVTAVALCFQSAWFFVAGLVQAVVPEPVASDAEGAAGAAAAPVVAPTAAPLVAPTAVVPPSWVVWREVPPSE